MTDDEDTSSRLGYSLSSSIDGNFIVAGAPLANAVANDGSTRFTDSGLVKVYIWSPSTFAFTELSTIRAPHDGSSVRHRANFGWSTAIAELTEAADRTTTPKYLFVGAPGHENDTGIVHMYTWGIGSDGSTYDTWTHNASIQSAAPSNNDRFGHKVATNDNGDILAVSSISTSTAGKVEIYIRGGHTNDDSTINSWTLAQTCLLYTSDAADE